MDARQMRKLTTIMIGSLLLALALPAAALAQSAGDEQYEDPLGGTEPEVDTAPPPPPPAAAQPAPANAQGSAQPAAPAPAAAQDELPRTGGREALLAALGLACLAAGLSLRRRAAP